MSALIGWHPLHEAAQQRMMRDVVAIPAHVVFDCFSVLTRLPAPHRLEASVAADAVGGLQRPLLELPATEVLALIAAMVHGSVFGGATYDGALGEQSHGSGPSSAPG